MNDWDVIVVGAGAAGLLAASRTSELGLRTILLEKNRKAGVKILMSGGTRCNITHDCDARGIVAAFGRNGNFLHSALADLDPKSVVKLFNDEHVATKVESTGKVFPVSNRAIDVRDALVNRLLRGGATMSLGEPVEHVAKTESGFSIQTPARTLQARFLLITTGGQSYPGCGTTGDGYRWLREFGHTIVPPRPALVPIRLGLAWTKELSGITLEAVRVAVLDPCSNKSGKRKPLDDRTGSFLFTHVGVSGPVVLDVSGVVARHEKPQSLILDCDFLPNVSANELDAEIKVRCAKFGRRKLVGLFEELPTRLVDALITEVGIHPDRNAAELTKDERNRLVEAIKSTKFPIAGTLGFEKAEVTSGGVALNEVDSRTLESKLVPGLYLAGEILDLDGRIGGYNFQAAFSTGWHAANAIAAAKD